MSLEDKQRCERLRTIDCDRLRAAIEEESKWNLSSVSCLQCSTWVMKPPGNIFTRLVSGSRTNCLLSRTAKITACLSRQSNEPFSDRILTYDKKRIVYNNPKRSRHWLSPGINPALTLRLPLYQKKHLLHIWWPTRILVYFEFFPSWQIITGNLHSQQFNRIYLQNTEPTLLNRKGEFQDSHTVPEQCSPTCVKNNEIHHYSYWLWSIHLISLIFSQLITICLGHWTIISESMPLLMKPNCGTWYRYFSSHRTETSIAREFVTLYQEGKDECCRRCKWPITGARTL